jgi:hypothetical protein
MLIPKTTDNKPYIEFRIDKKGKIILGITSSWWGGKNASFVSSDGSEGNSCEPRHLEAYIKAFKERKIKEIEKEIVSLQNKLETIK